jgi:hypothetical protein
MGVSYSSENTQNWDEGRHKQFLEHRTWLRLCAETKYVHALVTEFVRFNLPPFISKYQLECFVVSALKGVQSTVIPVNVSDHPIDVNNALVESPAPNSYSNDTKR